MKASAIEVSLRSIESAVRSALDGYYASTNGRVIFDMPEGPRFGDPHAVYNRPGGFLQACGFIALAPETANRNLDMFRELRAVELGGSS